MKTGTVSSRPRLGTLQRIGDPRLVVRVGIERGWIRVVPSPPTHLLFESGGRSNNKKRVYVSRTHAPLQGEVRLKNFFTEEAIRRSTTVRAVVVDFYRKKYRNLKLRRVNARVVFVRAA